VSTIATCPFLCGLDRVGRDLDVAIRPVLEADRRRQPRGELAVHLALRGARADRAPAHEVGDVLRADRVEELAGGRHAQAVDLQQQLARDAQPLVDAVALVQVGVVDQPLPAHGGAGLFEVHAHHDLERVGEPRALGQQAPRVLEGGCRVMDRARPDDHEHPVVLPLQDAAHGLARVAHELLHRRAGDREEADQVFRRRQGRHLPDALVVDAAGLLGVRIPVLGGGGSGAAGHRKSSSGCASCGGVRCAFGGPENKKPPGLPAVCLVRDAAFAYAVPSPAAGRHEKQKYAK
jgi:hypothetical protein